MASHCQAYASIILASCCYPCVSQEARQLSASELYPQKRTMIFVTVFTADTDIPANPKVFNIYL
jgi:hypothetical protein